MTWNDINAIIQRVLRRWWIVVSVLVIVVGATFFGLADSRDRYETTTLLVVGPNIDLEPSEVLRVADLLESNMVMATYSDVLASPRVVASGMIAVDPTYSDWNLYEVRVVQEPESNVMRMIVEGPDAEKTEGLAVAVQTEGQATLGELFPIYSISSLSAGAPEAQLVSLPWVRTIGIAIVIGLGLGVLLALWLDSLLAYRRGDAGIAARGSGTVQASSIDPQTATVARQ